MPCRATMPDPPFSAGPSSLPYSGGRSRRGAAFAALAVWLLATSVKGAVFDVLIVEKPGELSILNRYEQPLSGGERTAFLPYTPFVITGEEGILGDGITQALHVTLEGDRFSILKDRDGRVRGVDRCGYMKRLTGCREAGDTVRILRDFTLLMSERYPQAGSRYYLEKGTMVRRLFSRRNRYYIRTLSPRQRYGWCLFPPGPAWEIIRAETAPAAPARSPSPALIRKLTAAIERANTAYRDYFGYFNGRTGRNITVPRWKRLESPETVTFVLSGAEDCTESLARSTEYLVNNLRRMMLAEPFEVSRGPGRIEIQPRIETDGAR